MRFCEDAPGACVLPGPQVVAATPELRAHLARVTAEVNARVVRTPDLDCAGGEEVWSCPETGYGACEDLALEKRRLLVAEGVPSAALTMAIVHDRTAFFAHAVLLAETDARTLVLDEVTDALLCSQAAPHEFDRPERPDGTWLRYVRPNP